MGHLARALMHLFGQRTLARIAAGDPRAIAALHDHIDRRTMT